MTTGMSLRLRLTLLSGLLTGTIILIFALLFYLLLRTNLLREIDADLHARADLMARSLAGANEQEYVTRLGATSALDEFATPGIYVQLITADGQVYATSPKLPDSSDLAGSGLLENAGTRTTRTVAVGSGEQVRVHTAPVPERAGAAAMLIVAESLEPFGRTLAQARTLLVLGGTIAVALAVGGATILTSRALAPIGRLTRGAAAVAATGDYHERVRLPRQRDEIQQLAATINALIATVERTVAQQRQLLADTSHELRSPLTVVLANLNLLRRELTPDERALSLEEATHEAHRMRGLVNDLLLLAQADSTRAIAHLPLSLDTLVEEAVTTMARRASTHTLQAHISEPITVIGDQERLGQLLRNLIENATHHTPPGTLVEVRLRGSEHLAQLIVTDNGPGISAEHLARIWDRFYRVDKARSRAAGGSGLGLSIVKYVAEAHGGRVDVRSEIGVGTTFTVLLPLDRE